jgi:hypothetical protein
VIRRFLKKLLKDKPVEQTLLAPKAVQSWSSAELFEVPDATIRVLVAIPAGLAIGADQGLSLYQKGRFFPFPWPEGIHNRRVEALAFGEGGLHIGLLRSRCFWDFKNPPVFFSHPSDSEGGWDELACIYSGSNGMLFAYRERLVGAVGPPDILAMAGDTSSIYAGTRKGELWRLGESQPFKIFETEGKGRGISGLKRRPVRQLAWSKAGLYVAAAGALHCFNGKSWQVLLPEPTSLTADPLGRLWGVVEGKVAVLEEGWSFIKLDVVRPWSLCWAEDALWVGEVGRLWRVEV